MQPLSKSSSRSNHNLAPAPSHVSQRKWWIAALLVSSVAVGGIWLNSQGSEPNRVLNSSVSSANSVTESAPNPTTAPVVRAQKLAYRVVKSFPHDPNAFTQGLLWYDGGFYESTGLNGRSSLRRVEFPSGRVLKKVDIAPEFFAEGLALAGDKLYQLTWQSQVGFIYDRKTLKRLDTFSYPTEGWGLTFDGKNLILSDGSATLYFHNTKDFAVVRSVNVTLDGQPANNLNELEWIDGKIWANVWQTDRILIIDPQNGVVTETLDLTGILPASARKGSEDVLNGIAHDPITGRIFITGKLWPKIFQIEMEK